MATNEVSYIMIKPDGVQRGLVGEVTSNTFFATGLHREPGMPVLMPTGNTGACISFALGTRPWDGLLFA